VTSWRVFHAAVSTRVSETGNAPQLEFHCGEVIGDSSSWVTAKDELSLSLLQARLIDLGMPIRIAEGK